MSTDNPYKCPQTLYRVGEIKHEERIQTQRRTTQILARTETQIQSQEERGRNKMKTKKQKEEEAMDEAMEELLKQIPEGETAIITEVNGKTVVHITRTPYKHFPFSYII